jgi:hypothetical protein
MKFLVGNFLESVDMEEREGDGRILGRKVV